jgi:hypothetical protein
VRTLPVPEGVLLIGGRKSDGGEEILQGVADELSALKLSGKLDLYALPDTSPVRRRTSACWKRASR